MDLRTWQTLAEPKHERLIALAAEVDPGSVAQVEKLRREGERELVGAALDLAAARRKAVGKFGAEVAAGLWADPSGVEMASSRVVANHKGQRFSACAMDSQMRMADVCCGIGGDAMEFSREGMDVTAVDSNPVRAWMAGMNAGCRTVVGDAVEAELPGGLVHIDPARRYERGGRAGGRVWRLGQLTPGIEAVRSIVARATEGAAVKLGPGADLDEVERVFPGSQAEVISENGTLVQCVVWVGPGLAMGRHKRVATLLRGEADESSERWGERSVLEGEAGAETLPVHSPQFQAAGHVYEPDDSVERAGLLALLCEKVGAAMLHPRVGLLTSDARIESPWLTAFEVLEEMAWSEKRVKGVLEARGAGIAEVKTRGGVVEPDALQGRLRGKGNERLTVFVVRLGREIRAIVARRVA